MQNKGKIMLVDDSDIDLKINAKIISLTDLFEETISCKSGEEALDYIKRHLKNPKNLPQLILLDIHMPLMGGFAFLDAYSLLPTSFTANCHIAMLSSTLDFAHIKKSEANPLVTRFLKKPLQATELKKLVNEITLARL